MIAELLAALGIFLGGALPAPSPAPAFLPVSLAAQDDPPADEIRQLVLPGPVLGLELFDVDGDGVRELLVAHESGLEFRALTQPPGEIVARLPRGESRSLSWCLGEDAGGREALFLLTDGTEVAVWDRATSRPAPVHRDPEGAVPGGVYPFEFVRDLRGEGPRDLALVHRDGVQLAFPGTEGFRTGPKVRHRIDVQWSLGWPKDLPIEIEQTLVIPNFTVEDQNGDGEDDLIFEEEDAVRFFWTDRTRALPEQPSFELDLAALRDKLPKSSQGSFDPANLLKALEGQVRHTVRDLDGDGIHDLLLQMGPRVLIYAGTPTGFDTTGARKILKSSGNLLWSFAADENDDGRLDLCMLRIDDISLAEVLFWVVLGGSVKFDLFVYHQEGEALNFARRPSTHRTLKVSFGAILSIEDDLEGPIDRLREQLVAVPVPADFDGDGVVDDLAILEAGHTVAFYQDVPFDLDRRWVDAAWKSTLRRFDESADGERVVEVPLKDLIDWTPFSGRDLFDALRGRKVVYRFAFPEPPGWTEPDDRRLFAVSVGPDETADVALVESSGPGEPVFVSIRIFTGK